MKTFIILAIITLAESTIGVFVKLTDGLIPIQTLTFYSFAFATALLFAAVPYTTNEKLEFPYRNWKDTAIIGALIAAQSGFFNYAMTLVPIANAVIFWSVAPFFTFIFSWAFLSERAKKSYIVIFVIALTGIVIAKPFQEGYMLGNMVALTAFTLRARSLLSSREAPAYRLRCDGRRAAAHPSGNTASLRCPLRHAACAREPASQVKTLSAFY